jgi:hypothetical protein
MRYTIDDPSGRQTNVNYRSHNLLGLEFKLTTASTHSERNILVGLYCERTKDGLLGCQHPAAPDSVKTSPVATHENVWSFLAEAGSFNSNAKRGEEIETCQVEPIGQTK